MTETAAPSITFDWVVPAGEGMGQILLPFDQRLLFGRARPPVVVAIGDHLYRSTIAIMNGTTFVPLRQSNRTAAGVVAGVTVAVTLTLDTAPRTVAVPDDLAAAIMAAGVQAKWDQLSYSHQREWVEAVAEAKRPETRARRIAAAVGAAVKS